MLKVVPLAGLLAVLGALLGFVLLSRRRRAPATAQARDQDEYRLIVNEPIYPRSDLL